MRRASIKKVPFVLILITPLNLLCKEESSQETYVVAYTSPHSVVPLNPKARKSSFPYISGDAFREICNFIIDETKIPFKPTAVKEGDTIFVNGDCLIYFFSVIHPKIQARYILVTHNSDYDIPGEFTAYLDDPKLAAWCGQNVMLKHPKLHPLPIGLANRYWKHGNPAVLDKALATFRRNLHKKRLLYMNFTITHPNRTQVYELFAKQPFCTVRNLASSIYDPLKHLSDLAHHKFVLSPRGNGLDCHRTWESLLMGAIPIVQSSASDSLYDNLPVLIVGNWETITEQMLNQKYADMVQSKNYNFKKVYAPYWIDRIYELQALVRRNLI